MQKSAQNDAILRFVEAFEKRTGALPAELVFDSRLTTYAVLAKLQAKGIRFLSLRRRSASVLSFGSWLDKLRLFTTRLKPLLGKVSASSCLQDARP